MAKVLIIDDDEMICKTMTRVIVDMGHDANYALTLKEGIKVAVSRGFDVVFLDVQLPDGNGLKQLPRIQAVDSQPEVIIITGYANPDGAELAIKNNVWDYIKKPASIDRITLAISRALEYRKKKTASISPPIVSLKREGIIGNSSKLIACLDMVSRASNSTANILISGETGTGKELFSRAIHHNSNRAKKNFVVVDCGALSESIAESLIFGHKKGAFTGADKDEEGLIKQADGGTLFLDEIGELSLSIQKTFLRVLQERRFLPVGGKHEIESDFRLVAATNKNLDEMVRSGKLRKDLLFRIRSITIQLPPLRERNEDIKDLALHFMRQICELRKIGIKGLSPDFFEVMEAYTWPGNVRELYSVLESAISESLYEPTLFPKHLPTGIRVEVVRDSFAESPRYNENQNDKDKLLPEKLPKWQDYRKNLIAEGESKYLKELMSRARGNVKRASQMSGLSQPRIYELLREYKIST